MHEPTDEPGSGERRLWVAYLSGGFGLSISAMLALLVPLRANELGIGLGAVGVIVAARSLAETLLAVPLSAVIARLGSRGAFVASTSASAVIAAAFTVAEGFWALLLLNAAIGAARSLGWVASQSYISSQYGAANRARDTGRFSFVSNLSQMVTPLMVGGAAAVWGYRAAFLVIVAYCASYAVIGLVLAPNAKRTGGEDRVKLRAAVGLFRLPRIRMAMLLTFVRLWIPAIWTPLFPLLLVSTNGTSAALAGAVVSSAALVATLVNLLTGRLSRLASPEVLCTIALGLGVLGLVVAPFVLSVPAAFFSAALVGVANGLSLPLLMLLVSEAAPRGQRSLALATRNSVNALAGFLGPLGTGWLVAGLGATVAFPVVGGLAGTLLAGTFVLHRRSRAGSVPEPARTAEGH